MNPIQHGPSVSADSHEEVGTDPTIPLRGVYYGLLFSAVIIVLTTILYVGTTRLLHSL